MRMKVLLRVEAGGRGRVLGSLLFCGLAFVCVCVCMCVKSAFIAQTMLVPGCHAVIVVVVVAASSV